MLIVVLVFMFVMARSIFAISRAIFMFVVMLIVMMKTAGGE